MATIGEDLGKEAVRELRKVVENGAKNGAKEVVKKVEKKTVANAVEKGAEKAVEDAVSDSAEKSVKETVKSVIKDSSKLGESSELTEEMAKKLEEIKNREASEEAVRKRFEKAKSKRHSKENSISQKDSDYLKEKIEDYRSKSTNDLGFSSNAEMKNEIKRQRALNKKGAVNTEDPLEMAENIQRANDVADNNFNPKKSVLNDKEIYNEYANRNKIDEETLNNKDKQSALKEKLKKKYTDGARSAAAEEEQGFFARHDKGIKRGIGLGVGAGILYTMMHNGGKQTNAQLYNPDPRQNQQGY